MSNQTVLLIGEVFVDTHLDIICNGFPVVRLGGIFHAARALSALGVDYALAYYAPDYLEKDINFFSLKLRAKRCQRLGRIDCSPNVMLINESAEAGNQGYANILKDQAQYIDITPLSEILEAVNPTDILIFPGRYDATKIADDLMEFSGRLQLDAHYDSEPFFDLLAQKLDTLFLSTSSPLFIKKCGGTFAGFLEYFERYPIKQLLLKENRGGSVCYLTEKKVCAEAPAYYITTAHSVGVGDVYDSVFICQSSGENISERMKFAALCAARYAETMDFNAFRAQILSKTVEHHLSEIRLSWDDRKEINIYLAAPDFPDVDTRILDTLDGSLRYHNFSPRRPIMENGLAKDVSAQEKLKIYGKDISLLDKCSLLIAVLLNNDPGTLVELGMFKQTGKPTIIYDPFHYCTNMFVQHTPNYLCHTLSDVISATYLCLGGKTFGRL